MEIRRAIKADIIGKLKSSNKIIIIYGPRQVGKTTLANKIIEELKVKTLIVNADELKYNDIFSSRDLNKIKSLVDGYELLFIDEAQRIKNIGINLKIIKDKIPDLKVIVTGSSSLDLASELNEPLTGRTWTYNLYPISFYELQYEFNKFDLAEQLETRLIFGQYPEIFSINNREERIQYLQEISRSYLYKDVLEISNIKHSHKLKDLLKLLAFQIGSEVSLNELGSQLDMSKETVANYINLLEKSFVLFRLSGLSRNLRKEVSKMDKIYFYDLGIRNIIIDNMKDIKDRDDIGKLFENFLIIERLKLNQYTKNYCSQYFWRTYTGAELDYVEEKDNVFSGYEFKFGKSKGKAPSSWSEAYKGSYSLISKNNFADFVSKL